MKHRNNEDAGDLTMMGAADASESETEALEREYDPKPPPRLFNGTYTIRNRDTEEHRTLRIRTQPKDASFAPGRRLIGLLIGPENESDYRSFGFVGENGIHVWKRFQASGPWNAYARAIMELTGDEPTDLDETYDLLVSRRCLVCGRKLTTPESMESGIGPVCAGRES